MGGTYREAERKFDVDAAFLMPSLTGLPGVAAADGPDVIELEAVYYDSADLRLARRKVTLRRRVGGEDEGWHLKLPVSSDVRDEIRRPLTAGESRSPGGPGGDGSAGADSEADAGPAATAGRRIPDELLDLVQAYLRGAPAGPVVSLRTRRTALVLRDDAGDALAEVVDDEVASRPLDGPGEGARWREVEVELVRDDRRLLESAGEALLLAGAVPSRSGSKAARALGPALDRRGDPAPGGRKTGGREADLGRGDSAIRVIKDYLAKNVEALIAADPRVRLDEPDAVHKMRVASRRLRSTLRTFQPLFDADRAGVLDGELRDLAAALSSARDNEVLIEHFDARIAALPSDLVVGPVAETIHGHLRVDGSRARAQVLDTLRDQRYLRLLTDLEDLLASPGPRDPAREKAGRTLARLVSQADRRLHRKIGRIRDADPGPARDAAYHSARKQAKRLRYAAEAVTPVWGREAAGLARLAAELQEVLGDRQDAAVARELLCRWGVREQAARGPSAFTLGHLLGLEEGRAAAAERDFGVVWAEASRHRHRRWLVR